MKLSTVSFISVSSKIVSSTSSIGSRSIAFYNRDTTYYICSPLSHTQTVGTLRDL